MIFSVLLTTALAEAQSLGYRFHLVPSWSIHVTNCYCWLLFLTVLPSWSIPVSKCYCWLLLLTVLPSWSIPVTYAQRAKGSIWPIMAEQDWPWRNRSVGRPHSAQVGINYDIWILFVVVIFIVVLKASWSSIFMFRYGPASNSKWLLWGHDIYGVLSGEVCAISTYPQILGRTMEYCAKMNQDLGLTCVLPDFFRGVDGRPDPVPSWDQLGFSLFRCDSIS